ncbi:LLM class flavin-dependent oxidoreductase [Sphingomonas crocodyli]|uniref:LLM class flavin-dependent oxidoreductase n=1 Tax=Sphingomonas crocodyli TaxID=1979270 RepID=A0A437LYP3_9SPHN|nr:LLM class flavin-dependent oxidoreductase [Sphingomonas crocodyli]RVT90466.1 LLM class flavin-dependent oxidoreductase [Sphingomonas crocodyli]
MKFSTTLPFLRDLSSPDPYRDTFELAQVAEDAGFDTITIGQHHFRQGDPSDPLTVLGSVATRTSRIRVATGILILPMHNPLLIAEQVATIDQLSGGRISLGVGTGWNPFEYEVLGVPFKERGARMEEALRVLRLLWEKEKVSFDGAFYQFPELTMFPRPIQRPGPPLIVAGDVPVAVDRAARLGDIWMCGPVVDLSYAKVLAAQYRQTCATLNRKPDWILRRYGWIKPTRKAVEDGALQHYVDGVLVHWRESSKDKDFRKLLDRLDQGETVSATEIAHNRLVWGSPDDAIAQIEGFRDELGADHIHISFGAGLHSVGQANTQFGSAAELAEMFRLFGREVISAFQ